MMVVMKSTAMGTAVEARKEAAVVSTMEEAAEEEEEVMIAQQVPVMVEEVEVAMRTTVKRMGKKVY